MSKVSFLFALTLFSGLLVQDVFAADSESAKKFSRKSRPKITGKSHSTASLENFVTDPVQSCVTNPSKVMAVPSNLALVESASSGDHDQALGLLNQGNLDMNSVILAFGLIG